MKLRCQHKDKKIDTMLIRFQIGIPILRLIPIVEAFTDRLLREYYNQDFLLGVCPSRLFWTFNEANILLIVYFDNMFDLQSQELQLESV